MNTPNKVPSKEHAQLFLLLQALDLMRYIFPKDVKEYCDAVLAVAEAAGIEVKE